MTDQSSSRLLSIVLRVIAILFIGGYALTFLWPSGWVWHPNNPTYLQMIFGIYTTLGVFLWIAARDPLKHLSLIWFAVWANVVHAGIMAVHAFTDPGEMGHLPGDVAVLALIAAVLAVVTRKASASAAT